MKKILIFISVFSLILTMSSCGPKGKYPVKNGEVIINDTELVNSESIDDNNRVFYEIFTGSFSDSNGDGVGDLKGIINRLDYLNDGDINSGKSLGVQGIWLTPIFQSPTYHKYDVTDYYSIDSDFGTIDDLKELIKECHKRDIKIIIDLPINHTGENHRWFRQFAYSHKMGETDSKYYDYYSYYTRGETCPSGRSFTMLAGSNIFYESNFTGNMPELNFDNEEVREEVLNIAKYYIELGIDGFRFDAAKYIYYGNDGKSASFWKWYVAELKKLNPNLFTVGEVWSGDGITDLYYSNGLNCFNFTVSQAEGKISLASKQGNVSVYTNYVESYLNKIKTLNQNAIMHQFIANHDTDRAAGFLPLSNNYQQIAANLYILSPGAPFIYYGEEIGMKGTRGGASSDANRRLAMLWGDNDTIEDPKEATYGSDKQTNGTVKNQKKDENSLYNYYKKLIMIRNAHPAIARGEYKSLPFVTKCIGGFKSTYNDSSLCVIHNTSWQDETIDLSLLGIEEYKTISAYIGINNATIKGTTLTIGAQTSVILV